MKPIRIVRTKKEIVDIKGWTIPVNIDLYVMNDSLPPRPWDGKKLIIVRVENGTERIELCPETAVFESDISENPEI